jgi:hypothetical protein
MKAKRKSDSGPVVCSPASDTPPSRSGIIVGKPRSVAAPVAALSPSPRRQCVVMPAIMGRWSWVNQRPPGSAVSDDLSVLAASRAGRHE